MKKTAIVLMSVSLVFMSGCWDMAEINERIFPYSVGIDLNPDEGERYIVTISYPNIFAIGKNATQEERIYNVSSISSTIYEGIRQVNTRIPYPLYFKHLGTIVIGKTFAEDQESMRKLVDSTNRDFTISKRVRVIAAEHMAHDLLKSVPIAVKQEAIEGTLFNMLKGNKKTSRYIPQNLTRFLQEMDMGGVSIMPRATFHGEDLKIFGGCVFKNFQFVGHLGELQNRAVALMRGNIKETLVVAPFEDICISYSVSSSKAKKQLEINEGDIKITIHVETEGVLREYIYTDEVVEITPDILNEMEKAISKTLEEETKEVIRILQKDFKADGLGIAEYLQKFHPKIWEEVSDDWEGIFPGITIEPVIDAKIRRMGLTG